MQYVENRIFDELKTGDSAEVTRTLSRHDLERLALQPGDTRTAAPEPAAERSAHMPAVAHGTWISALIASVIENDLPGPGTTYITQRLDFKKPVALGDAVTVHLSIAGLDGDTDRATLTCTVSDERGNVVAEGEALVVAPTEKMRRPRALPTDTAVRPSGARYSQLIASTRKLEPIRTAVIHPCDEISLSSALEARAKDLIVPVLVGPVAKVRSAAEAAHCNLSDIEIVDVPHSHAAAERAVAMARAGEVDALMKGALHTDEVMEAAVDRAHGLRTERRMSHVFVLDVPTYPKPLLITDAAINIAPDLMAKADIAQNAIDLAHALAIAKPKVAILSAVETVEAKIASTVEAAALCKMADRGQITGGTLDGPLAFDNAVSKQAAEAKHIRSPVAGDADILLVPDLEAGNMLAKQLIYLAGAEAAGIVLGARVPIILTSRADGMVARLASCAMAQRFAHRKIRRKGKVAIGS